MKTHSTTLSQFVEDFNLFDPSKGVCFDAIIYYSTPSTSVRVTSPVQIVTIEYKNLTAIYLLGSDVTTQSIPDMVTDDKETITYIPQECLVVTGISKADHTKFTISIHPHNGQLKLTTIQQLHSKKGKSIKLKEQFQQWFYALKPKHIAFSD